MFEALLEWLHGEILVRELGRGGTGWKEEPSPAIFFERAIEIARLQQARSLELRATTSLTRWLKGQGQAGEAAARLGAIYGQFQEGVDTHDLCEARDLLVELR